MKQSIIIVISLFFSILLAFLSNVVFNVPGYFSFIIGMVTEIIILQIAEIFNFRYSTSKIEKITRETSSFLEFFSKIQSKLNNPAIYRKLNYLLESLKMLAEGEYKVESLQKIYEEDINILKNVQIKFRATVPVSTTPDKQFLDPYFKY